MRTAGRRGGADLIDISEVVGNIGRIWLWLEPQVW